jgi:glycosyltransferase involved in cell wall biosynthesis
MEIRVFMEGPLEKTGGVSNHMRYLLEELSKEPGVHLISYDSSRGASGAGLNAIARKMYGRFIGFPIELLRRRKEYDIVHTQSSGGMPGFVTAIVATLVTNLLGKEQVFTFHHSRTEGFIARNHRAVKFVLDRSSACILVSDRQKDAFIKEFGPASGNRIHIIPNGFNPNVIYPLDRTDSRNKLSVTAPDRVLLNIAILEGYKGHDHLVDAMKILCERRNDVHLYILGHGPLEKQIRDRIERNGLSGKISLMTEYQSPEQIRLWHNSADIFVLSSLHEGNPTVMFECMACGIPFVGTKVGGVPQIISSEKYGLLCEAGDPTGLAENMMIALERHWDRSAIIDHAGEFHWSRIADETVKVYEAVLRRPEKDN